MADLAVKAQELVKWFGEGDAKTFAVRGVGFEAYFGEMLYIEGPLGSSRGLRSQGRSPAVLTS